MSTGQFRSFGGNRGKPNPVNEQNPNISIPAATNVVVCRAHGKPSCQECLVFKSPETHTCNAMLSSEVELKCGCVLPVIA